MERLINAPTLLTAEHQLSAFGCGQFALDDWLKRRALPNQDTGASRTYVIASDGFVIGYYALASGAVTTSEAPGKIRRNMPDPIPVMILARFAVDNTWQGKGLGADLLQDAVLRTMQAAAIGGMRAMMVHAKDISAVSFYEKHGFIGSEIRPLTLFLPLHPLPDGLR